MHLFYMEGHLKLQQSHQSFDISPFLTHQYDTQGLYRTEEPGLVVSSQLSQWA